MAFFGDIDFVQRGAIGNRRSVSFDGPDYYPTPPWAVHALLSQETFDGPVYEPCCGAGKMALALSHGGMHVVASDIIDYGYAECRDAFAIDGPVHNICTNPPYNSAEQMLRHFLKITKNKIAMLLRLSFLESRKRYPLFQQNPPSRVYVFPERLSLSRDGEPVNGGGTISYGWFIWDKSSHGETVLRWLPLGFKSKTF